MQCIVPSLFGFAPGGVYLAGLVTKSAVRSYRTFSPLPGQARRFVFCGTFPGVAPAGHYPAPCIHGARTFLTLFWKNKARPSGPLDIPHVVYEHTQVNGFAIISVN